LAGLQAVRDEKEIKLEMQLGLTGLCRTPSTKKFRYRDLPFNHGAVQIEDE
jgi:hypothetical protein